tara:strand:- start:459 stop:893 length:435 start_codon:yes stop_codon:yes gene_type:complete
MAMQQDVEMDAGDIAPALNGVAIEVRTLTRLKELKFPAPSEENIVFVFETLVNGVESGIPDTVIHVRKEPQAGDPAEPVLDPIGELLVEAGEHKAPIPSVDQIRAMPLPTDPSRTFGQLMDEAKTNIYLAARLLNPDWSDSTED